jgi:hypothetical protein
MILQEIQEKDKTEHARSMAKHGKWKGNLDDQEQSEAIRLEFIEWYKSYVLSDIHGEHGEIAELIHLRNVCARRIMFLTGEDQ